MFVPLDQVASGEYPASAARRTFRRARRAIARSHDWPNILGPLEQVDAAIARLFVERARIVHVARNPLVAFPKLWALHAQIFARYDGVSGEEAFVGDIARKWAL